MRQAIICRYLGYTNTKPSRIKATCQAGSVTIPKDPGDGDNSDPYIRAARALIRKLGWTGHPYYGGVLPNGDIVFVDSAVSIIETGE